MDFALSDEQQAIRQTVRRFVAEELLPLEPDALRTEADGGVGVSRARLRELQLRAREFGFWGMATPAAFGGMELPALTQALVYIELARTFIPFRFGGDADNILFEANDEQRAEYLVPTIEGERHSCFALTEPNAGSDAANISTTARRDGDDWIINGEKTFISGGDVADYAIVIAVTDPERGAHGGMTAFLVDRSMGWTAHPFATMGQGLSPASLVFADVRVPNRNVLGETGRGFELAMRWIGKGRYRNPARAVGTAERVLQMGIDHANRRTTFGQPIGRNQAIQWMIADSEVELESVRWLVLHAAWMVDAGRDARHACSMAKLAGATMANQVVDRVLQIHGGMGYTREMPIERWYREVRVWRIYEGSDEMQRLILARDLLRGYTHIADHLG